MFCQLPSHPSVCLSWTLPACPLLLPSFPSVCIYPGYCLAVHLSAYPGYFPATHLSAYFVTTMSICHPLRVTALCLSVILYWLLPCVYLSSSTGYCLVSICHPLLVTALCLSVILSWLLSSCPSVRLSSLIIRYYEAVINKFLFTFSISFLLVAAAQLLPSCALHVAGVLIIIADILAAALQLTPAVSGFESLVVLICFLL